MSAPQRPGPPDAAPPDVPQHLMAEAAVWVAKLHGPSRDRKMELACLAWQAQSPAHSQAFEICTDGWEMVGGITVRDVYAAASARKKVQQLEVRRARTGWYWATGLASIFLLLGAAVGGWYWHERGVYATEVGEQRSILLEDGSRLLLNTASRVRVDMEPGRRSVEVAAGEVLFDVAKDARRPFVVHAGGTEVVALGTSFVVRFEGGPDPDATAVTLLSGRVSVQPTVHADVSYDAVAIEPGQRVRIDRRASAPSGGATKIDRPAVEQLTAWKRNEIVFDNTALADAVHEMNRYNRSAITLSGGTSVGGRKITGTFKTSDVRPFVLLAAEAHGLKLEERRGGWVLGPAK